MLDRALLYSPNSVRLLSDLANIHCASGNWSKGKEYFLRCKGKKAQSDVFFRHFFIKCHEHNDIAAIEATNCNADIKEYFLKHYYMNRETKREIFGGFSHFSNEYFTKLFATSGNQLLKRSVRVNDMESEYVNAFDGVRRTAGVPEVYAKTIYLLGASQVFGSGCEDSHTIASFLQSLYNSNPSDGSARVVNIGVNGRGELNPFLCLMHEKLQKGDVAILFPGVWRQFESDRFVDDLRDYAAMREYCALAGASFHIALLPSLLRIENPSRREQLLRTVSLLQKDVSEEIKVQRENFAKYCELLRENNFSFFQLDDVVNRPHSLGEVFWDEQHFNHRANKAIAQKIYAHLAQPVQVKTIGLSNEEMESVASKAKRQLKEVTIRSYASQRDIAQWLREVRNPQFDNCGSIGAVVMNCNPFTLGHRHLIESAAKAVDGLYVFVVQEDKSFFTFADRLSLVQRGIEDIRGTIHVVPSGKYIISSFGFPGYFAKEQAITPADSTADVAIFGSIIAPALRITHRFVGEEPNCLTTNEYNETMQFLLPALGVKMHVIPRKSDSGHPISATTVRDCLKNGDFESIAKLVPPTTYEYLKTLSRKGRQGVR